MIIMILPFAFLQGLNTCFVCFILLLFNYVYLGSFTKGSVVLPINYYAVFFFFFFILNKNRKALSSTLLLFLSLSLSGFMIVY